MAEDPDAHRASTEHDVDWPGDPVVADVALDVRGGGRPPPRRPRCPARRVCGAVSPLGRRGGHRLCHARDGDRVPARGPAVPVDARALGHPRGVACDVGRLLLRRVSGLFARDIAVCRIALRARLVRNEARRERPAKRADRRPRRTRRARALAGRRHLRAPGRRARPARRARRVVREPCGAARRGDGYCRRRRHAAPASRVAADLRYPVRRAPRRRLHAMDGAGPVAGAFLDQTRSGAVDAGGSAGARRLAPRAAARRRAGLGRRGGGRALVVCERLRERLVGRRGLRGPAVRRRHRVLRARVGRGLCRDAPASTSSSCAATASSSRTRRPSERFWSTA